MYLYVTEKIKYYYKIGIAEKLWERLGEYRTLIPDLNCSYEIDLPNNVALAIEKAFKKVLARRFAVRRNNTFGYNIVKSECYNLKFRYIEEFILNCSVLMAYPLIHIRYISPDRDRSSTSLKSDRSSFKYPLRRNDTLFIYLDKIYFKKYIPLMSIKQIDQKKAYVEIIENISLDQLEKKANWLKENLNLFRLSNPLFKNMKNYDKSTINNISIKKIVSNLQKKIFDSIKDYLLDDQENIKVIDRRCLNRSNSSYIKDFSGKIRSPYLHLFSMADGYEPIDISIYNAAINEGNFNWPRRKKKWR